MVHSSGMKSSGCADENKKILEALGRYAPENAGILVPDGYV